MSSGTRSQTADGANNATNDTQAPEDPNRLVNVKASALDTLKEKAKNLTVANRKIKDLEKIQSSLEKECRKQSNQILTLTDSLEAVNKLKDTLEKEGDGKDEIITKLKEELDQVKEALRKGGKVAECELNKTLIDHVTEATKKILFRTVKFVQDDEDLKALAKQIVPYLPNKEADIKPLTTDEFADLYYLKVNDAINLARQHVGNEGKKRVQGKCKICSAINLFSKLPKARRPNFDTLIP